MEKRAGKRRTAGRKPRADAEERRDEVDPAFAGDRPQPLAEPVKHGDAPLDRLSGTGKPPRRRRNARPSKGGGAPD